MESTERSEVLAKMYSYFKNGLKSSKPAREYIQQRGLLYQALDMGFNSGQYHHGKRKDESLIESCIEVGLLTPHGTNTRAGGQAYKVVGKDSIVFALKNQEGNITGFYFRTIQEDGLQKHAYLKDSKGLYPAYPDKKTSKLLLTKSITDAATLLQINSIKEEYTVLSTANTNRLTEEHIEAITQLDQLKEIIFAFENNEIANKAVEKYANQLKDLLPNVIMSKLNLPEGEDCNSLAQSHEDALFNALLEKRSLVLPVEIKNKPFESPSYSNQLNTQNPYKLTYKTSHAVYAIQGGIGNMLDSMKVTLAIEHIKTGEKVRSKIDLYEDKEIEALCKKANEKLNIPTNVLQAEIYLFTNLLDEYREKELFNRESQDLKDEEQNIPLTVKEREVVENFSKHPDLIKQLEELLGKTGIVGEVNNRIFLFLIAASYKMPEPMHVLIQGSSGSGKTRLLKQIAECIPKEKVIKLTRVSNKVLYNYPKDYFINRLVCLEDIDGLPEEAEFALRELQSNGELNSATSSKLLNGQIVAGVKKVKGPIASLSCTTRGEIYEDNMSRMFLLAVDESVEQTKRIIDYQNQLAAGILEEEEQQNVKHFLQQFVRQLKPFAVVNPYATHLHLPDSVHKVRRLNELFQSFVKMVTLINQYQRKQDSKGRLITDTKDIKATIDIMFESIVLKVDELDGSLRNFYERLKDYLIKTNKTDYQKVEFSQREIRQALQVSKAQVHRYLSSLLQLEYIQVAGGHVNKGYRFKISYWDDYKALREKVKVNLEEQLSKLTDN